MYELAKSMLDFRKKLGLTQSEMAKKVGLSQRAWSAYEKAQVTPPLKILLKLKEIGFEFPNLTTGIVSDLKQTHPELSMGTAPQGKKSAGAAADALEQNHFESEIANSENFDLFKFSKGRTMPIITTEDEASAMVLLPVYGQTAAAGKGQPEMQLTQVEAYIPILYEMLGGAAPKNCGIVRVVGDSMTDMNLFNGDFVIFDRTQLEGDGVYVISIGADVRVKRLEYRPFERKIIISSENAKRYPNPEVITYEQAENLLRIHGKVICWMHRHPY